MRFVRISDDHRLARAVPVIGPTIGPELFRRCFHDVLDMPYKVPVRIDMRKFAANFYMLLVGMLRNRGRFLDDRFALLIRKRRARQIFRAAGIGWLTLLDERSHERCRIERFQWLGRFVAADLMT